MIEVMQRRALSPLGVKRVRIGRKAMATARVHAGIERKLSSSIQSPAKKSTRKLNYTFRRWHAIAAVSCIAVIIIGSLTYGFVTRAQQQERQRQEVVRQKQEAAEAAERQKCYQTVLSTKADQLGKLTYDQLYAGACDS